MEMSDYKIGYFIVSNGRADKQLTYELLRSMKCNEQDIHIVCDDMDDSLPTYLENFGDRVRTFDKMHYIKRCDSGVQQASGRHPTYGRNACFDIARELEYTHIIIADDDIKGIYHRAVKDNKLISHKVDNFPKVAEACIKYMHSNNHIRCIGFGTSNTFIGGINSPIFKVGMTYLIANIGIYKVDKPITYVSECQEDLIASVRYTERGELMCVIPFLNVDAITEGRNGGGIVGHYDESNTFYRYFGTLIYIPATVTIRANGKELSKRNKSNYIPMILSDRWKK